MKFDWKKNTVALLGAGMMLAMVFANAIGLDDNAEWGLKRYLIFLLGCIFLLLAFLLPKENLYKWLVSAQGRIYIGAVLLNGVMIMYYIWCVSIGSWATWFYETNYYDLQASAFASGQIALQIQPDPALLALQGAAVYEPANREGIPVLWDASFYNGNYYLYWGPAPAFLLVIFKLFHPKEVGDNVLTFLYTAGTFIFLTLISLHLRQKYFNKTPAWAFLLTLAFCGLVNPMTYILFEPRIYEAAIIGAQFFLMGGIYFLLRGLDSSARRDFAFCGVLLACAAGSRTTLIPAILMLVLVMAAWAFKTHQRDAFKLLVAAGVPLAIGAVSYAAYNMARFNNPVEFGLKYQLTSYNLYKDLEQTFSAVYIAPNLFKTLLNPLEIRSTFPHLFATRWAGPEWLAEKTYPDFYLLYAESITGIFIASPFLIFIFFAGAQKKIPWEIAVLGISTLATFITLQFFFFTAMRYLLDVIPTLAILASIGFWQGLERFASHRLAKFTHAALGVSLFIYSAIIGFALSISAHFEQIRGVNPDLLQQIGWYFKNLLR